MCVCVCVCVGGGKTPATTNNVVATTEQQALKVSIMLRIKDMTWCTCVRLGLNSFSIMKITGYLFHGTVRKRKWNDPYVSCAEFIGGRSRYKSHLKTSTVLPCLHAFSVPSVQEMLGSAVLSCHRWLNIKL